MVRKNAPLYEKVILLASGGEKSFVQAEDEVFDLNHIEVGRWIAEKWRFPEAAIRAVAFHHHSWPQDESSRGKHTSHAMLVKVADTIAHAAGIGHPANFRSFQQKAEKEMGAAMTQIGMSKGQSSAPLINGLKEEFDREFTLYQAENL
jgi:HD-like signal output (HDOD) protein